MKKLEIPTDLIGNSLFLYTQTIPFTLLSSYNKISELSFNKTFDDNFVLNFKSTTGVLYSYSTGSYGWDINSQTKIGYALSLDGSKIVFNIPDTLLDEVV